MRVGFGYDSHRFEGVGQQKLGGIAIPGCPKLKGHSDADVLTHAVIDALLGAAALGDIGSHFPDNDPKWKDADSIRLLESAVSELREHGFSPSNIDVTVICERPKLRPCVDAIRRKLADTLAIDIGAVSVKGKTNEGMDAIGSGMGIAVHAVALIA